MFDRDDEVYAPIQSVCGNEAAARDFPEAGDPDPKIFQKEARLAQLVARLPTE